MIGAGLALRCMAKCSANRSASIVALVMMSSQVGPLGQQALQVAEQKVDVERPLVGLVDDQRVVLVEEPIVLRLGQQHAVGHHLDRASAAPVASAKRILKPTFWPTDVPSSSASASGDRAGRDAPRLRVADQAGDAAADFQADLRELRRFAAARFAADDDDLMVANRRGDFFAAGDDRQRLVVDQLAERAPAALRAGDWIPRVGFSSFSSSSSGGRPCSSACCTARSRFRSRWRSACIAVAICGFEFAKKDIDRT